ncbi:MAG: efflux RND transporter periplasmic adaptor subunit [Bacteroidales bacterium]|nr:efflux RND transporter periplasmic adaptor subunit [Bacteroidales bacterium]
MKKILKITLWTIVIAIFAGTIVYLYDKSKSKPKVFETQKPYYTDIVKKTVATGSVVPRKEIEIKPQISGIIQTLYVQPGDVVKENQLIAKVKIIPNMVNLNEAESRLEKAKIRRDKAKTDFQRRKKLYEQEVISEAEFLEYKTTYQSAKEDVKAAENNLELIKKGVRKEADKASNTLIRSTIDGMVLDVPVEIGNSVIESNNFNDGTTIASVADMNQMVFEGKVDETEVGKIHENMDLILTIGAIDKEKFNAQIEYISPKGVEENGAVQFEIKAAVKLKESTFIRAGYSANADIVLQRRDSVMAIKEGLVQFDGEQPYVEVKTQENQFDKREVEVGLSDGINIEVKSGLTGEEEIKVIQ